MVVDKIIEFARTTPDHPAFIFNGQSYSYLHVVKFVESTRRFLRNQNLKEETTAIILIDALMDAWIAILAARAIGLTSISASNLNSADLLSLSNVSCIITNDRTLKSKNFNLHQMGSAKLIVLPSEIYSWSRISRIEEFELSVPNKSGHICLSSSSTGAPKKILFTREQETAIEKAYDYSNDDRNTVVNVLNYSASATGSYKYLVGALAAGATVLFDQTDAPTKSIFRAGNSYCTMRPTTVKDFLRNLPSDCKPNRGLVLGMGGGQIKYPMVEPLLQLLTPHIHFRYSTSELAGYLLTRKIESSIDLIWLDPSVHRSIEIVDLEGNPVNSNSEGMLRVRLADGDAVGYLDDPVATSTAFRDGYFYPGDMAVKREDGRVRILGRVADVLNLDGQKYPIGPIEADLCSKMKVRDLCLFARQNSATEQELFIVIECDSMPHHNELEAVKRQFSTFDKVHFWPFQQFPRNLGGKTDRLTLQNYVYAQTADELSG